MKFSIDTQHDIFCNRLEKAKERQKKVTSVASVEEFEYCIDILNTAHTLFKARTKTTFGYICSFIPFTFAYKCRAAYHNRMLEACDKLRQLEANIEKAEKLAPKNVTRGTSAPELPKNYPSPIATPQVRASKSASFIHVPRLMVS